MLNNLLTIGRTALSNFQVALNVTGENITNSSDTNYSEQTVQFEDSGVTVAGLGNGASVQAILRQFDAFLETQCLQQSSASSYQQTLSTNLSQVESLFNDTSTTGVTSLYDSFMTDLQSLSADASNASVRTTCVSAAQSLTSTLNTLSASLDSETSAIDSSISSQTDTVNGLLKSIAGLNTSIAASPDSNDLKDQRDEKIRELATYLDVQTITQSDGEVRVLTGEGQTLVDGSSTYSLTVEGPKSTESLSTGSGFDGMINFEGTSSNEFTIRMISSGDESGGSNAATFKVSLDGGKTWLTSSNGGTEVFRAGDSNHKVTVDGVSVWFSASSNSGVASSGNLSAGDSFDVMPKSGLYWKSASGGEVNVTPLSGNTSANRLSGGSLAGLFALRDQYVGEYQERLDAFTSSLVWNMNRIHSQGAGLTAMSEATGSYAATSDTATLEDSGLPFADKITSGSVTIALYDSATGSNTSMPSITVDPSTESLQDVADSINSACPGSLTATVENGKLSIQAASGVTFQFAGDTSGLLAGLGINTLFTGTDASNVAVSGTVADDPDRLCAGHVDGDGEVSVDDNQTALELAALNSTSVSFTASGLSSSSTLLGYLTSIESKVGADASAASTSYTQASTLSSDLENQRESVSGVSLDEELTKLMQYQQNYQAAAKLIQTASDMFTTILDLK